MWRPSLTSPITRRSKRLPPTCKPRHSLTALALYDDERSPAAQHNLDRAIALAPNELDLHELAAQIATELSDVDAVIAAQKRVIAARSRDTKSLAALAELLIGAERIDEAIALRNELPGVADRDDAGVQDELMRFFDQLTKVR